MFRNQYNSEVTLYSPEGRLLQIEYAKTAAERGGILISIKSSIHLIFLSLNQKIKNSLKMVNKFFSLDSSLVLGASGIINDGKIMYNLIKHELKKYQTGSNGIMPIWYLCTIASCFFHINTIYFGARPFGVDLLIGGYDKKGLVLFKLEQDKFYKIKLKTAIGEVTRITDSSVDLFLNSFKNFSDTELLLHIIGYAIKNITKNQKNCNLLKERINICLVGKKLKATFFCCKVNKFFIRCFFKMKI